MEENMDAAEREKLITRLEHDSLEECPGVRGRPAPRRVIRAGRPAYRIVQADGRETIHYSAAGYE